MNRLALLLPLLWCVANPALAQTHLELAWPDTDFSRQIVELREIRSGGPPKDGIPSIDSPEFERVADASAWIDPLEPVIALSIGDRAKAYPLQILIYHEIVNDEIADVPVAVTFCPLCNASIVFDRRLNGEVLDFGTTGLLRMSDLVMYDRQSESWWQQFTGRSIIGEHAGARLTRISSSIVSFDAFRLAFPDGQVLGRNTGHSRPYGRNPYYGYDRVDQHPFLFGQPVDGRLPPMERVLNVTVAGQSRIYPFRELSARPVVNDRLNGTGFVVFAAGRLLSVLDDESIRESKTLIEATAWKNTTPSYPEELTFSLVGSEIRDDQTDSVWNALGEAVDGRLRGSRLESVDSGVHFAFAWLAFNPETDIHSSGESG